MNVIEVVDDDYKKQIHKFIQDNYGHNFENEDCEYKIYAITTKKHKLIAAALLRDYSATIEKVHLCCICVDKNMRKQGIGSKFIEIIKQIYDGKTITLSVLMNEASLIKYYMKLGAKCGNIDITNNKIELSFDL
jgi:ribosomal protein S18 acetylase RimI-like enzyme